MTSAPAAAERRRPPTSTAAAQAIVRRLLARFDPDSFEVTTTARLGIDVDDQRITVELSPGAAREVSAAGRPEATLSAALPAWRQICTDVRGGMDAFAGRRLRVRGNLHLAVGFLAATSGSTAPERLRIAPVPTSMGELSTMTAGSGEPVLMLHGLGATKASFLPTIAALAPAHRVIAVDLPGFGDSCKPFRASYDAAFFARSVVRLLDALELDRAHVVGHSMGGRAALETALEHPDRVASVALVMPSMAWLRARPWAPLLRVVRPELGVLQLTPRPIADRVVRRLVPGADDGWLATAVDEFLRSFCSVRGRTAFYAAARSIYLEDPSGPRGLWRRLPGLRPPALFVWGRRDGLVPAAFSRHVERLLPGAEHLNLDCGHVPQIECPKALHATLGRFFAAHAIAGGRPAERRPPARRAS